MIVVATPRTGSRAIKEVILQNVKQHESPIVSSLHHDFPHKVIAEARKGNYEIWTIIREPISQLKSWISHAQFWHDPDDFIQTYHSRYFMYEGGMNIYGKTADKFFVYESNGHAGLIKALGLRVKDIPVVGKTGSKKRKLTLEQLGLAYDRFEYDFKLYDDVLDGKR